MTDVRFPEDFIPLKNFDGYFWNTRHKQLYSIKVNGVLTPLKVNSGRYPPWVRDLGRHYQISHRGRRRYIPLCDIDKFLHEGDYVIKQDFPR